ncbi:MAG: molybdenum cofactor guanylyltransferase [Hadesarchaea archaeon]|nr:MAG: molybdenum cofactor guanylyltransferase [Hadesarchaea archaeon]TDA32374.1 MAG: molybdenum cofactor guanylyltransferase [Hadesarchaea archaeon]
MKLALLILAGGRSERWGKEKALVEVEGKPLLLHVLERLEGLSEERIISSKPGLGLEVRGVKLVEDFSEEKGAVIGLLSSLPQVRSEYVAVVACDHPRANREVLEKLAERAEGRDGAVPRWPNGYIEPLYAVYKTESLLKAVREAGGEKRLRKVLEKLDIVYVPVEELREADPQLDCFFNLNSPEDLPLLPPRRS